MTTTLYEKTMSGGIDESSMTQIMLALYELIGHAERGLHLDPKCVAIDENCQIQVDNSRELNLQFTAPEVFLRNAEIDQNAMWFSLGLLIYFMLHRKSYYAAAGLRTVDLVNQEQEGNSLIRREVYDGALAELLEKLTAWEPAERKNGTAMLPDICRNTGSSERWLILVPRQEGQSYSRLFRLREGRSVTQTVRIMMDRVKQYDFYAVPGDAKSAPFIPAASQLVFSIELPAVREVPGALLKVWYDAEREEVSVSLYSSDGREQISDNVEHFPLTL